MAKLPAPEPMSRYMALPTFPLEESGVMMYEELSLLFFSFEESSAFFSEESSRTLAILAHPSFSVSMSPT